MPNVNVMRTIEDTLHELDPELRRLSLDIHGERDRTEENRKQTHTSDHPELNFEERLVFDSQTFRMLDYVADTHMIA